jgi:hypothetical protein
MWDSSTSCPGRSLNPGYTPMGPTLVREPFHRAGWVYEEKVDGWRILAYKDGARVRLVSRRGLDHSGRFPELVDAIARLGTPNDTLNFHAGCYALWDAEVRRRERRGGQVASGPWSHSIPDYGAAMFSAARERGGFDEPF